MARPAAAGSGARNTALPATRMSTPAAAASPAVSTLMPPSISISHARPRASISLRAAATLSSTSGMNACPPQPGFTLITSSRSIWSRYGSTGVDRRGRVEHEPDAHVARAQVVEQRTGIAELDVHDAAVGAGVGEVGDQHAGVVDHQVAVEEQVGVCAQRLHHRRTDGEVGHEVAVHHVDVQEVGDLARPARRRRRAARSRRRGSTAPASSRSRSAASFRPEVRSGGAAEREDVHAVGAGGLREEQRAATVRPSRGSPAAGAG